MKILTRGSSKEVAKVPSISLSCILSPYCKKFRTQYVLHAKTPKFPVFTQFQGLLPPKTSKNRGFGGFSLSKLCVLNFFCFWSYGHKNLNLSTSSTLLKLVRVRFLFFGPVFDKNFFCSQRRTPKNHFLKRPQNPKGNGQKRGQKSPDQCQTQLSIKSRVLNIF